MERLIKNFARKLGLEVKRFSPANSNFARMQRFFANYKVDVILDVGANEGQFALFLRDLGYSQKIVSFEPISSAYSKLQSRSKNDPLWEIAPQMAIGDRDGKITINLSQISSRSSLLNTLEANLKADPGCQYISTEVVQLSKLDTIAPQYIANSNESIFLKIDVQGFEPQVLAGATQVMKQVQGLQLELSLIPLYEGQVLFRELIEELDYMGYELYAIFPGFTDLDTGRLLQVDGVFVKKQK